MKKLLYVFMALMVALPMAADEKEIPFDKLPEKAQKVIKQAFPESKVKKVEMERRASLIQYEVKLTDGTKLQFSKDGNLTECECTKTAVPAILIPAKIRDFVASEFPDREIYSFEHDGKLFELLLDNGDELSFNRSYRLIDIDRAKD